VIVLVRKIFINPGYKNGAAYNGKEEILFFNS
jgi:hypothetical protein